MYVCMYEGPNFTHRFFLVVSVMKNLNLSKYFDFILPSCLAGYEKPAVEVFERARFMAGPDILPSEALHIGDDPDKQVSIFTTM